MSKIERSQIIDYGYDGEGVCKVDGKIVFVPYTLKDEIVEINITQDKSSFCRAEVNSVLQPSTLREKYPCPYYSVCGGCTYQHTSYENELMIKKSLLQKQLSKVCFKGDIQIVASEKVYGYRNKIRLFVNENGLCLKKRKSAQLCQIEKCLLVETEMNRAIEIINIYLNTNKHYKNFCEIVIRQEEDQLLINFYKTSKIDINYQGLYLMLGKNYGIFETYKGETTHKVGLKYLSCNEFGLSCRFSPNTFHQVNDVVSQKLYSKVIENLIGKNILNCYSGAGVLSGVIAKQDKRVVGIELGKNEHKDAERLKDENNLFYLTNYQGDCAEVMPRLNETFSTIVIDPPRGGVDKKVVQAINDSVFERLIYISCDSATLVRDLSRLENITIKNVFLFDMFARTGEYEILVIMDRK